MIAPLRNNCANDQLEFVHQRFLSMLPQIRRDAWLAFVSHSREAREDLVQEVIANAYCRYVRLVQQGKENVAYASPLARFGIRQVRDGRRVGSQSACNELLSPVAHRIHGLKFEPFDEREGGARQVSQLLTENRHAGPAETAAARIDIADWFRSLSKRNRRIAKALAVGEPTGAVARRFNLSCGRVSQLRSWFRRHWEQFQGGGELAGAVA